MVCCPRCLLSERLLFQRCKLGGMLRFFSSVWLLHHSHAITSERRISVFWTPGAKAVTVWSLGLVSDWEQKDLGVQRQQAWLFEYTGRSPNIVVLITLVGTDSRQDRCEAKGNGVMLSWLEEALGRSGGLWISFLPRRHLGEEGNWPWAHFSHSVSFLTRSPHLSPVFTAAIARIECVCTFKSPHLIFSPLLLTTYTHSSDLVDNTFIFLLSDSHGEKWLKKDLFLVWYVCLGSWESVSQKCLSDSFAKLNHLN